MIQIQTFEAITPYGENIELLGKAILNGDQKTTSASSIFESIHEDCIASLFSKELFSRKQDSALTILTRTIQNLINRSELKSENLKKCGLVIGTSGFICDAEQNKSSSSLNMPGTGFITSKISQHFKFGGPVLSVTTACTSSSNAIQIAASLLDSDQTEYIIVVGIEIMSHFFLSGFQSLMLISEKGCRPFDKNRKGIHPGESCAALLLKKHKLVENQSGTFLAASANVCDTHNVISINPDGSSIEKIFSILIKNSMISKDEIIGIKAHGIGIKDTDLAETRAIKNFFGTNPPPFTSIKGILGHTMGASGAVELAAFLYCLQKGFIPPTQGFQHPDPEINIHPLKHKIKANNGYYILNSFGFGGNITSLLIKYVH